MADCCDVVSRWALRLNFALPAYQSKDDTVLLHLFSHAFHLQSVHYARTGKQDMAVGLQPSKESIAAGAVGADSMARPAPSEMEGTAALMGKVAKLAAEVRGVVKGKLTSLLP